MKQKELTLLPGLELIGRGIIVRPDRPYELKRFLFPRASLTPLHSPETGTTYAVPEGHGVNHSPPMPSGQALNQTVIEESWDRFDKQLSLDARIAAGNGFFSIDASASRASQVRSEEEAYYAMRTTFLPLWTIYVTNELKPVAGAGLEDEISVPFRHRHRRAYDAFFAKNGTHYVKRVWVGGKASLAFTVAKSSTMNKADIKAGLKASLGLITGGLEKNSSKMKERLQNQSECTVFGQGGDEVELAALSTLDEARYLRWLNSIKGNPQPIEIEVAGIWTLLDDPERAAALRDAYRESTAFAPVSAMFELDKKIYFIRRNSYFTYDIDLRVSEKPRALAESWQPVLDAGFEHIDAALRGRFVFDENGAPMSRKLFFFQGDQFLRCDVDAGTVDPGYPKKIAEGWPGVPFESIDAVFSINDVTTYFFSGNKYVRFNGAANCVDEGYPELIRRRWPGMTFDRIDTVIYEGNGKAYFFSGMSFMRYDTVMGRADAGYPRLIVGNYIEDWDFFD